MEQYQYAKKDLEKRLNIVLTKGEKIEKCLVYALDRLVEYHNEGARGLVSDAAFYELYGKIETALNKYKSYNDRVTKNINTSIKYMQPAEKEKSSSVPRRSID